MDQGTRVYIYSEKRESICDGTVYQSGYLMYLVDESAYYSSDILNMDIERTNSELWNIVDNKDFPAGMIVTDQEGNEFVYTGKSFQILDETYGVLFKGFCKGDKWRMSRLIDFEEEMEIV
ncbi:hypothetical protein [Paenibacillus silvae]|uniref:YopX protein domain-containing protein n=1 Tax=Paenibacillus silvae TaxID=1325358 RepID=A0A2W6NNM0_9BACL|nr:hypothetical protein [Paenibacillus silvae]PZT57459.1 hypothetical protein DN757_02040 [Paenibacillus silvae]